MNLAYPLGQKKNFVSRNFFPEIDARAQFFFLCLFIYIYMVECYISISYQQCNEKSINNKKRKNKNGALIKKLCARAEILFFFFWSKKNSCAAKKWSARKRETKFFFFGLNGFIFLLHLERPYWSCTGRRWSCCYDIHERPAHPYPRSNTCGLGLGRVFRVVGYPKSLGYPNSKLGSGTREHCIMGSINY